MLSGRLSTYGCTREVGRARGKRESCTEIWSWLNAEFSTSYRRLKRCLQKVLQFQTTWSRFMLYAESNCMWSSSAWHCNQCGRRCDQHSSSCDQNFRGSRKIATRLCSNIISRREMRLKFFSQYRALWNILNASVRYIRSASQERFWSRDN